MKQSPLVVVAALVLTMALSPDAWAGCNSIPDAQSAVAGGVSAFAKQGPATKVPTPEGGLIGFKGALGRIDRIHLIPGRTTGFRIQPDGQCVHGVENRLTLRRVPGKLDKRAPSDFVVSLLTRPARGEGVQALVLASEQVCDALDAGIGHGARKRGVALHCVPHAPVPVHPIGGPFHVQVGLPTDRKLYGGDGTALRGPVKVVLTEGLPNPAEYLALLSKITTDGCAAHCDELIKGQASGCLDSFYVVLKNGEVVHDPIPCEIAIPDYATKNDFQALCEDLDPAPPDLAHCSNAPTGVVQLWEDSCGGVHIPFDWTKIRKTSSKPSTDITRWVAGRSATSRTEKGKLDSKRIWIPGREFLGSTPWDDPSGTYGSNDWRKTDIDVWYPDGSPEEIGLRGSTDQPDSVVHVYPRMPVYLVCKNGSDLEGCMGVGDDGGVSCQCGDQYDETTCVCELLSSPKYFACDDGEFKGMPCTRHAHCDSESGNSGNCSQQPTCRQDGKNGVWPGPWLGTPPPTLPGGTGPCWDDGGCGNPKPVCGYRLFDFWDRREPIPGLPPDTIPLIELDVEILPGGHERRGVCKEPPRNTKCNKANACPSDKGPCRGFTLRAEGKKN